jgi:hypothetical protein
MSPPDINYMPASITPGGQVVAAGGAGPLGIAAVSIGNIVSLKQIVAVQTEAAGAAGDFILTGLDATPSGMSPTMLIPVGPSVVGDRIVQDFAVPYRGGLILLEVESGMGVWKIITVGFVT